MLNEQRATRSVPLWFVALTLVACGTQPRDAPPRPQPPPAAAPVPPNAGAPMSDLEAAVDKQASAYIASVLDAVARAERGGFTAVADDEALKAVSEKAYYGSRRSIGAQVRPHDPPLFRSDRHPYVDGAQVKRAYHVGKGDDWDFLRHELTVDGTPIVVIDGVNEALVLVIGRAASLLPQAAPQRAQALHELAETFFAAPWSEATWLTRGAPSDIAFTTARDALPTRADAPRRRMDAGVRGDDVYFLFYKQHNDQKLKRPIDPRSWFGGG